MTNLNKIPLEDGFETSLSQEWDGQVGSVKVNTTPNFTFPAGVTTYIVVNPTKANIQIAEIDWYDAGLGTINVTNITLEKGASVPSTAQLHSVNSKVIISDNYQFWKDIRDAINSKMDIATGNHMAYDDDVARDAAITSPADGMIVYLDSIEDFTSYKNGVWVSGLGWDGGTAIFYYNTTENGSLTWAVDWVNTDYGLSNVPWSLNWVIVAYNGIVQDLWTDYNILGQTISFVTAPTSGKVTAHYSSAAVGTGSAQTRATSDADAVQGELYRSTDDSQDLYYKNNGGTPVEFFSESTQKIPAETAVDLNNSDFFISETIGGSDSWKAIKTNIDWKLDNSFLLSWEVVASEDIDLSKIIYIDSDGEAHISRGADYGTDDVSDTGSKTNANIFYLTSDTFVLVYDNNTTDDSYAVAGTIINSQITLWTRATIDSSVDHPLRGTFWARLNDTQFVVAQEAVAWPWADLTANVCTVTWTSISVWPAQSLDSWGWSHQYVDIVAINDTKFIINWYKSTDSEIKASVCTVAGSIISPWANTTIHGAVTSWGETQVALIWTDKVLFMSWESSNEIRYRTWTITWTAISLGGLSNYSWSTFNQLSLQRVADDVCIASWDENGTPASAYITISGTSVTRESPSTWITWRVAWINWNVVVFWATDHYYLYLLDTTWYTFSPIWDKVISARNSGYPWSICLASNIAPWLSIHFDMISWINPVVYISDISINKLVSWESVLATESLEVKGILAEGFTWLLPWITYYDSDNGDVSPYNTTGQEIWSAISSTEMILK